MPKIVTDNSNTANKDEQASSISLVSAEGVSPGTKRPSPNSIQSLSESAQGGLGTKSFDLQSKQNQSISSATFWPSNGKGLPVDLPPPRLFQEREPPQKLRTVAKRTKEGPSSEQSDVGKFSNISKLRSLFELKATGHTLDRRMSQTGNSEEVTEKNSSSVEVLNKEKRHNYTDIKTSPESKYTSSHLDSNEETSKRQNFDGIFEEIQPEQGEEEHETKDLKDEVYNELIQRDSPVFESSRSYTLGEHSPTTIIFDASIPEGRSNNAQENLLQLTSPVAKTSRSSILKEPSPITSIFDEPNFGGPNGRTCENSIRLISPVPISPHLSTLVKSTSPIIGIYDDLPSRDLNNQADDDRSIIISPVFGSSPPPTSEAPSPPTSNFGAPDSESPHVKIYYRPPQSPDSFASQPASPERSLLPRAPGREGDRNVEEEWEDGVPDHETDQVAINEDHSAVLDTGFGVTNEEVSLRDEIAWQDGQIEALDAELWKYQAQINQWEEFEDQFRADCNELQQQRIRKLHNAIERRRTVVEEGEEDGLLLDVLTAQLSTRQAEQDILEEGSVRIYCYERIAHSDKESDEALNLLKHMQKELALNKELSEARDGLEELNEFLENENALLKEELEKLRPNNINTQSVYSEDGKKSSEEPVITPSKPSCSEDKIQIIPESVYSSTQSMPSSNLTSNIFLNNFAELTILSKISTIEFMYFLLLQNRMKHGVLASDCDELLALVTDGLNAARKYSIEYAEGEAILSAWMGRVLWLANRGAEETIWYLKHAKHLAILSEDMKEVVDSWIVDANTRPVLF